MWLVGPISDSPHLDSKSPGISFLSLWYILKPLELCFFPPACSCLFPEANFLHWLPDFPLWLLGWCFPWCYTWPSAPVLDTVTVCGQERPAGKTCGRGGNSWHLQCFVLCHSHWLKQVTLEVKKTNQQWLRLRIAQLVAMLGWCFVVFFFLYSFRFFWLV